MAVEPAAPEGRDSSFPRALGRYVPFARLGSGGMAEVFLSVARGPVGFSKVAVIKRLRDPEDDSHVAMFLDEARLSARMNHPNIVHTYEVGETDGYFIAMEYLEGQSLQALLTRLAARREGLREPLAAYIATLVLKGLHYAHDLCDFDGTPLGIVHRDVSPQNLYLTYRGEVKVLDFGIAKATMNSSHTEAGVLKGKVRYMAPEQLGAQGVDRRADVFAFGVVLWELLARRALFQGDAASVMARLVNEDVTSARAIRAEASPALDAIALKALRRDPNARYATADEMRIAIEDYLRESGDPELDKELARLMNELFAQTRDEVRGRIKAFLARLPPTEDGSPGVDATRDLPSLLEGSEPHTPPPTTGMAVGRQGVPRWSWLLLAVGASVAGVVGLGRLGRRIQNPALASEGPGPAAVAPALALEPGHLRILTDPEGAQIGGDGIPSSTTPAALDLPPGTAEIRLSLVGYETETITVDVTQGASLVRSVALRGLPAAAARAVAHASPPAPRSPLEGVSSDAPAGASSGAVSRDRPPRALPKAMASGTPRLNIPVLDDGDSP